jgi:short subunit dehydrogenase-like uncharacterized protein
MAPRIVIFAPTGFTGDLTVKALVADGQSPLLVGRSENKLKALATTYGGLDYAVAEAGRPDTLSSLVSAGDVLVALAGPFVKVGYAALEAAVTKGAHYLDSTGEPPFIRDVFERYGPRATAAECVLLTAMGYDYVPGNLAAVHALRDAGERARRVKVGYFVKGPLNPTGLSGGTRASLAGILFDNGFRREGGVLEIERAGVHYKAFDVGGKRRPGVSLGASEHFTIPQAFPNVRSVETYLGWFGPASRAISLAARTGGAVMALPPLKRAAGQVAARFFPGSTGGPSEEFRAKHKTLVVAEAYDEHGTQLSRAVVSGASPYDFTGRMLAWGAQHLAASGTKEVGALGPATAFGVDGLIEGARIAGIERTE